MPEEGNVPRAVTTAYELYRVLVVGNQMLHNIVGGGNGMGGETGTTAASKVGQQQGAGRGGKG